MNGAEAVPSGIVRGTPAFRRASLALFLAGFSTFSLLYCVQPLLPLFVEEFLVTPAQSALPLSLATALLAFAILCAAVVSEGLGRRGLMFVSITLAATMTVAAAAAPDWAMLLWLRAATGFVLGGVPAVAMTWLAEELDSRSAAFTMGLYVGGTAFGGMAGRVGAGIMAQYLGWRWSMGVTGCIGLVAAVGFIALLPASRHFTRRRQFDPIYHLRAWRDHLSGGGLPLIFAIAFLTMGAFITLFNYAGFRLRAAPYGLDQTEIGLIFLAYLFGIASSGFAGSLSEKFGRRLVLPGGLIVMACGIGLTMASSLPLIILGIVIIVMGFFFTHSVASAGVGLLAKHARGHASSLYHLAYYGGSSLAGWMGGWFWAWQGWSAVAGFTLLMLVLALAAALQLNRITRREIQGDGAHPVA